jgi:hypothetical protein
VADGQTCIVTSWWNRFVRDQFVGYGKNMPMTIVIGVLGGLVLSFGYAAQRVGGRWQLILASIVLMLALSLSLGVGAALSRYLDKKSHTLRESMTLFYGAKWTLLGFILLGPPAIAYAGVSQDQADRMITGLGIGVFIVFAGWMLAVYIGGRRAPEATLEFLSDPSWKWWWRGSCLFAALAGSLIALGGLHYSDPF